VAVAFKHRDDARRGMHWRGHVGAALLAFAPLGAALSAAGAPALAGVGLVVAATLATLPDIDERLPMQHRGWTHTVWFVAGMTLVASGLGAVAGGAVGRPLTITMVGGGAAAIALTSHLAADVVTPMGVRPFAPLWGWHYTFDLTPARNPRANATLLALGVAATVGLQAAVALAA